MPAHLERFQAHRYSSGRRSPVYRQLSRAFHSTAALFLCLRSVQEPIDQGHCGTAQFHRGPELIDLDSALMASSSLINVCDFAVVSAHRVPINPADALRQITKMYVYNGRGSFITTCLFSQTDAAYNFNKCNFASTILASCVKFGRGGVEGFLKVTTVLSIETTDN